MKPRTLRRAIRPPRKAHLREEGTSEHADTKAELGEVEGGAGRRRGVWNKVEELGKLQWQAAAMAHGAEARERESAHGVDARMASVLALSTGEGGGRGVGERACRPRGAVGLTRSGARGTAMSERGGRRWTRRGEGGLASLAGPVGWRQPPSEQPFF